VVPVARELNQRVVMWTLIPGDWRATSSEWLIPRIQPIAARAQRNLGAAGAAGGGATTGDILCLHDGSHRQLNADRLPTLAALEHWLPRWRDLGLEFVTIDEAVSAPAT
jgi:peptidoglycan/xylan/chitin deacetylase (PgdA/CDA1 family)